MGVTRVRFQKLVTIQHQYKKYNRAESDINCLTDEYHLIARNLVRLGFTVNISVEHTSSMLKGMWHFS